jgi:mannosyl-3-phosphoglycerate phosphatase
MPQFILFTDLDSPLFDALKQDTAVILLALHRLKAHSIPIIPVTQRTRAEILPLRQHLDLSDPFITENGSGIFIPQETLLPNPPGEFEDGYYVVELGCPYVQTRAALRVIANELQHSLLGFGDMTIERLQKFADITAIEAQQTKEREFSEPFITPKSVSPEQLIKAAQVTGFQIIVGDPFSYLIGPDAGKAKAIQQLTQLYRLSLPEVKTLTTLSLSHNPNDPDLLTAVDIPLLLPNPTATGWVTAIQSALRHQGLSI